MSPIEKLTVAVSEVPVDDSVTESDDAEKNVVVVDQISVVCGPE